MQVSADGQVFDWVEGFGEMPAPEDAALGWAHHDLAVTRDGRVVGFHPERPEVVVLDAEGRLLSSFPTGLRDGHGITLVEEDGEECVWLADPGSKMRRAPGGGYERDTAPSGQVVQFDLTGKERRRLATPNQPRYEQGPYRPTSAAVNELRFGGSGDIWVADGYGESVVHRFDATGQHLDTLTGEEGGGRFNCPHAVFVDHRRPERPELLVADRANARVQVYDLDGRFDRVVGEGVLDSPSVFATLGDQLVVGELRARLTVLGPDDGLVGYLGENGEVCSQPGWPNALDEHGRSVRTGRLEVGRFNSPHGLAADAEGNLYVAEWLIGGRLVKLVTAPGGGGAPTS